MIVIALVGLTVALVKDEYHPKLTILDKWVTLDEFVTEMDLINLINWVIGLCMIVTFLLTLGFCYLFIVPFYKQEKK